MKKIPLNSLVFLVDVSREQALSHFVENEFVDINHITTVLFGDHIRPDLRGILQSEIERLTFLKLSLGQRVVVNVPDLRRDVRINIAKHAVNKGYNVFYLVDDLRIRRDLASGDRVAEVVDLTSQFEVCRAIGDENFFDELKSRGYNGLTVVGDVHGMLNPLRNAVSWARSRNNFLLFLGDLVDYGIDSLEVVTEVHNLVVRGEAEAIIGNHENKIFRYLNQMETTGTHRLRLSEGNKVTTERIESLNKFDRERWVTKFKTLYHYMRNHRVSDNFIFTHASIHPSMWEITDNRLLTGLEHKSLYGEIEKEPSASTSFGAKPNRVYNWVDEIPEGKVAIVGHDIRSPIDPFKHVGINGGVAFFVDTGCGKGGNLSSVDIRFTEDGARVENFNIH